MNEFQFAEAYTELTVRDAQFRKAMNVAHAKLMRLRSTMETVARYASRAFMAAAGAIAYFVKQASDAEEIATKFNAVFKEGARAARQWSAEYARAIGRSRYDLEAYMSTFQDTFVPIGFARGEAAKLSETMTRLALDLASFNNAHEPETVQLLTSALVGNHEAVRRFGIVLTEATVKQELLNMGLTDNVKTADPLAKVMARLNIILRSTTDAQGDALRTAGSMANRWRAFTAEIRDLSVELGKTFIPLLKRATEGIGDWIRTLKESTIANREAVLSWTALGAGILGVLILAPKLVGAMTAISAAIAAGSGGLTFGVMALVAALGVLAAGFVDAKLKGIAFGEAMADIYDTMGVPGFSGPGDVRKQQAADAEQAARTRTLEDRVRALRKRGQPATVDTRTEAQIALEADTAALEQATRQLKVARENLQNLRDSLKPVPELPPWGQSIEIPGFPGDTEPLLRIPLTPSDARKNRARRAAERERRNFIPLEDSQVGQQIQESQRAVIAAQRRVDLATDARDLSAKFRRQEEAATAWSQRVSDMRGMADSIAERLFGAEYAKDWAKAREKVEQRRGQGFVESLFEDKTTLAESIGKALGSNEWVGNLFKAMIPEKEKKEKRRDMPSLPTGAGQFMSFSQLQSFVQSKITEGERQQIELAKRQLTEQEKINENLEAQNEQGMKQWAAVWGQ